MNRILLSFFCFVLFTSTNYAQYTSIINANRPGDTETPYSVGKRVLQIENSLFYNNFHDQNSSLKRDAFSNNINIQYGFLSERLQANINHTFTHGEINRNIYSVTGTENISIGLKYLIYEHVNKESPELKKSWKRRYGFKYNGLIPSIAVAVNYHTPFANSKFFNGGLNSFSVSIITQNNINKKIRINNQLDYHNFLGNYAEMVYSVSSSYVIARRWNPYFQLQLHGLQHMIYTSLGIGTPFLVHKDLALSAHYNVSFADEFSGHEIGLNVAFRIDRHRDKWEYINKPRNKNVEEEDNIDIITSEKKALNNTRQSLNEEQSLDDFIKEIANESTKEEIVKKETKKERKERKKKEKRERKEKKKKEKEEKEPLDDVILSY